MEFTKNQVILQIEKKKMPCWAEEILKQFENLKISLEQISERLEQLEVHNSASDIQIEAPCFDGSKDPSSYVDWESEMNSFFKWYQMSERRKVLFASTRLKGRAMLYWQHVESRFDLNGMDEPIETWDGMKEKLRQRYLPHSYKSKLLDQWHRLSQGDQPVSEYISEFDELFIRVGVYGDQRFTISKFKCGLRENIGREFHIRDVTTLPEAYQLAQNLEKYLSKSDCVYE